MRSTRSAIRNPLSPPRKPSQKFRAGDSVELWIEKLVYGGEGLGRKDGIVVFVPFTAPGDRVRVRLTEVKKNFARADLLEVISPSSHRVLAPCNVFGSCGGCHWQHLSLDFQRATKESLVREAFSRAGIWGGPVPRCLGSDSGWNYRRRAHFKIEHQQIGFHQRRSHRLCDVSECAIVHPAINQTLLSLRRSPPAHSSIELEVLEDGSVAHSIDQVQGLEFGFSQINAQVNRMLVDWVVDQVRAWSVTHILDLCAGRGNFTIPVAMALPTVRLTGVELNSRAVEIARRNSADLPAIEWVVHDVEHFLLNFKPPSEFGVILDPPRMGLSGAAVEQLGKLNPRWILWIGCDLQNLVRDLGRLFAIAPQFQVRTIQPFDMFPQTFHIETAVTLTR